MAIQQLKQYRVLLIGESCLDVYSFLLQKKTYKETRTHDDDSPVFVLQNENKKFGMAANVKASFESLGCQVDFLTNESPIIKQRLVNDKNKCHVARIDTNDHVKPLDTRLLENIMLQEYDAVVFSDYDKGFVDKIATDYIVKKFEGPIFVDSKKRDLSQFEGCILKINEIELKAANKFPNAYRIIVTLGKNGAIHENQTYKPHEVEVIDVCGAGDNFLVGLCIGYLQTNNMPEAIRLGNYFASLALGHVGNYVVEYTDFEKYHE